MTVLMSLPSSTETEIFLTCLISCYCTRWTQRAFPDVQIANHGR
jgi:hypothetical protein